ncbi:hypothetical protein BH09ACT8_BH09ACT8_28950 [soil metagenome]
MDSDVSRAIIVFLRRYPGNNADEFSELFSAQTSAVLEKVREMLAEAMRIEWNGME